MPKNAWPYLTPGLPGNLFRQDGVPLSKKEVRALVMAGARLRADSLVYDIGAGSGGFTVEAALLAGHGTVWAVEKNPQAIKVLRHNLDRWKLANVRVVEGEAPEALMRLPKPDRVLIGGSGGRLKEILEAVMPVLPADGRLVLTAVQPETLSFALQELEKWPGWRAEAMLAQFSHLEQAGEARIWRAANPVVIVAAERKEGHDG